MKIANSALLVAVALLFTCGHARAGETSVTVQFSTSESSIIREYYRQYDVARGPGKKKRSGALPPGIAKNLGRGKPLPPGIAKQLLPGDLTGRLPPVPDGFERVVVGGKILLVEIATQLIHDILTDVIL